MGGPPVRLRLWLPPDAHNCKRSVTDALRLLGDGETNVQISLENNSTMAAAEKMADIKRCRLSAVGTNVVLTPSLAIIIFIKECQTEISQSDLRSKCFGQLPWRFHHVTQNSQDKTGTRRVQAQLEFYGLSQDLPLFSASSVHFGCQIVRVNIFAYHYDEMLIFYSSLLRLQPTFQRNGFSYFQFVIDESRQFQLSIKGSSNLMPYPLISACMHFCVDRLPDISLEKCGDNSYFGTDPDGNAISVEIVEKKSNQNETLRTLSDQALAKDIDTSCNEYISSRVGDAFHQDIPDIIRGHQQQQQTLTPDVACLNSQSKLSVSSSQMINSEKSLIKNSKVGARQIAQPTKQPTARRDAVDIIASF